MVSSIHTEYEYSKVIHLLYKSRTNSLVVLKIIYRVRVVIVWHTFVFGKRSR